jgi:hypothetical protein
MSAVVLVEDEANRDAAEPSNNKGIMVLVHLIALREKLCLTVWNAWTNSTAIDLFSSFA